jgi:2'-5' RNA ligase
MRLFAAIVPPRDVIDEVRHVVESLSETAPAPIERSRGIIRRLAGRAANPAGRTPVATETSPVRSGTDELEALEPVKMYLPISGFGNVTLSDSVKLTNALRAEVAAWRRPRLVFSGGAALEFPGDDSVWVKLDGDIDELGVIGRGIPTAVQRLGFFVDRRQFRPWMSVGTITDTTTAPYLERLVAALDAFRGEPWTADAVYLMKWLPSTVAKDTFEELARLPLG